MEAWPSGSRQSRGPGNGRSRVRRPGGPANSITIRQRAHPSSRTSVASLQGTPRVAAQRALMQLHPKSNRHALPMPMSLVRRQTVGSLTQYAHHRAVIIPDGRSPPCPQAGHPASESWWRLGRSEGQKRAYAPPITNWPSMPAGGSRSGWTITTSRSNELTTRETQAGVVGTPLSSPSSVECRLP